MQYLYIRPLAKSLKETNQETTYTAKGPVSGDLNIIKDGNRIYFSEVQTSWFNTHITHVYDGMENLLFIVTRRGYFRYRYTIEFFDYMSDAPFSIEGNTCTLHNGTKITFKKNWTILINPYIKFYAEGRRTGEIRLKSWFKVHFEIKLKDLPEDLHKYYLLCFLSVYSYNNTDD